jgi:CRISPR-associated endonuclease Csn1
VKDKNPHDTYHESVRQWKEFQINYILSIEDDVLINFQPQHRTLTPTYKNVRKRGKQQFLKEKLPNGKWQYKLNDQGERIPLVAKGDSIRGQLHKESFFGAIKLKNGNEKWLVERYPISTFTSISDCKHIIDEKVKGIVQSTLEKRISEGQSFEKAKLEPILFPNGKEVIKKVRCKVVAGRGYLTPEKALEIKKHAFLSKHEYKQFIYAQNEENTLCLYYEDEGNNERAFRVVGLFELSSLHLRNYKAITGEKYYQTIEVGRGKNKKELRLKYIIKPGMRVILFKDNWEELKELRTPELLARLYRVYKFNEPAPSTVYVYLQHHLEARPNDVLGNGVNEINFDKYQPRIFLNSSKFACALEGLHFNIQPDGVIGWLY